MSDDTSTADCKTLPDFRAVPGLPRDEEDVVFAAPWEAKAFALIVHLHQRGAFPWQAWVDVLSHEIAADVGRAVETPYYELWLSAAEKLMTGQGLLEGAALGSLREALRAAQGGSHDHDHDPHDHDHHSHPHDHHH